ncbi:MAG: hypothetical protein KDB70_07890 [Mycobacterium sp.]|jgi:hypothetical protein|nr:hypothetical protein [Mycobacterium sp.]
MLPLYEGKMGHQFNHRAATFTGVGDTEIAAFEAKAPNEHVLPRYWVRDQVVKDRLARRTWGTEHALLGFRRVARNTDERTVIASFLPYGAASYGWILSAGPAARDLALLCAQYNSFVFDFVLRQFLSQPSIPQGTFEQLPILTRHDLNRLGDSAAVETWIITRVAKLVGDSVELAAFVDELDVKPEVLDDGGRISAELDAAIFVLFGIDRDDVDYIMETFPIVKRKDVAEHGEYRTKRMILEVYDAMAEAERTGVPYISPLDDLVGKGE